MISNGFLGKVASRIVRKIDKNFHARSLIKRVLLQGIDITKLSKNDRFLLIAKARWIQKLQLPGYNLKFRIRSKTEFSRVRKFKETWTIDWINRLPAETILWDVGANIGIMTSVAALRPEIEKVVAVEPFFKNYSVLVENLVLNKLSHKVVIVCGGLGEETSFIPLKLQNMVEGGSMHSFGDIAKIGTRSTEPVAEQSCLCFRVDDLVEYEGIPFPTHMKIDIDGFELNMLRGAEKSLADKRLVGIQVETLDHEEELPNRAAVSSLLEGHGFRLANEIAHQSVKAIIYDLQFVR